MNRTAYNELGQCCEQHQCNVSLILAVIDGFSKTHNVSVDTLSINDDKNGLNIRYPKSHTPMCINWELSNENDVVIGVHQGNRENKNSYGDVLSCNEPDLRKFECVCADKWMPNEGRWRYVKLSSVDDVKKFFEGI